MAALRAQRDAKASRVEQHKQKRRLEEETKDKDDDDVSILVQWGDDGLLGRFFI